MACVGVISKKKYIYIYSGHWSKIIMYLEKRVRIYPCLQADHQYIKSPGQENRI